jgi:A/G-specific adenine glycosylase
MRAAAPPVSLTQPRQRTAFRRALLAWYRRTARDLPWRRAPDPYNVWLSEIMLQQTRVETVVPYFERFRVAFPTVRDLAAAPQERVLKLWEGLGYYSRARNLHAAAQHVAQHLAGAFPTDAAGWAALPGVGPYTAGAIASIAGGEAVPAVDGNVKRVLARLCWLTDPIDQPAAQAVLWEWAERLLAKRAAGDFNQALMELGARVCTPRKPACESCPVGRWCAAGRAGRAAEVPVRSPRRTPRDVSVAVGIVAADERWLIQRRPQKGLLAGLWGWPLVEVANGQRPNAALRQHLTHGLGLEVRVGALAGEVRHEFTHRRWHLWLYRCRALAQGDDQADSRWVTRDELDQVPMATLDRKVLAALAEFSVD